MANLCLAWGRTIQSASGPRPGRGWPGQGGALRPSLSQSSSLSCRGALAERGTLSGLPVSSQMGWYSLWLEPTGRLAAQLQGEIDRLMEPYEGPAFSPHVTLAAFSAPDDETAKSMSAEIVPKLQPYFIRFKDVGYGESYHQCVFMLSVPDPHVLEAAAVARESLGLESASYMPHLSFLYSDIDEEKRKEVVLHLQQRLYGESQGYDTLLIETGFKADGMSLWRTPAEDKSLKSWTKLADFRFGAGEQ